MRSLESAFGDEDAVRPSPSAIDSAFWPALALSSGALLLRKAFGAVPK